MIAIYNNMVKYGPIGYRNIASCVGLVFSQIAHFCKVKLQKINIYNLTTIIFYSYDIIYSEGTPYHNINVDNHI